MDLSGIDFGNITDLGPLYVMDDLTDLWLVDTVNLDATDLDVLLDNLATIEGTATEGILYMTQANFDAFNTAGGVVSHVERRARSPRRVCSAGGFRRRRRRGRCGLLGLATGRVALSAEQFGPRRVASEFSAPVSGDFDEDGDVDGADFLAWQRGESPIR